MKCFVCDEPATLGLCEDCSNELEPINACKQRWNIDSLFKYDGLMQEVIHLIKIANSHQALNGLLSFLSHNEKLQEYVSDCDIIVPAPSSVWGRMRGRFDLAEAMAIHLTKTTQKPHRRLSTRYYLRFKKRAGSNADTLHETHVKKQDPFISSKRVLLIDDITTTGWTMREYESVLLAHGAKSVSKLAIAAANGAQLDAPSSSQ